MKKVRRGKRNRPIQKETEMETTVQNIASVIKLVFFAMIVPGGLVVLGALWVYKKKRSLEDKVSELTSALSSKGDLDKSKESTNDFNKAVDQYEHDRDALIKALSSSDPTKPQS
jgi:hypothetical protein